MNSDSSCEAERIRAEYQRREREIASDFYALYHPANLFIRQSQDRALLEGLRNNGLLPLQDQSILEIGCGTGAWLGVFENFGARRQRIAAIDLDEGRAAICRERYPGADIRSGNASDLPWPDAAFDVIFQSTVFTSILDPGMKRDVAREMLRVLKPKGAIVWYDFYVNNPRNPHVRGVGRAEIQALFPGCSVVLRRTTLAPPLARRLVPISWNLASMLGGLRIFNTHYMGVFRRGE